MSGIEDFDFDVVTIETKVPTKNKRKVKEKEIYLPDVSVTKHPNRLKGGIWDLLKKEKGEPYEHYQGRIVISEKLSNLGSLNPVACVEVSRLIMNKLRLGVLYDQRTEEVIEHFLNVLSE